MGGLQDYIYHLAGLSVALTGGALIVFPELSDLWSLSRMGVLVLHAAGAWIAGLSPAAG